MPALGELARRARKAPTRFFVGGADCNLHFFVTDLAENISLKEITTEFTGRAPVENTHFTPIIDWIQRRTYDLIKRILFTRGASDRGGLLLRSFHYSRERDRKASDRRPSHAAQSSCARQTP